LTQVEQGVWDQLVAMLRDWLKGMGVVDPQALTDADLANAVRAAIRWTRYGEGGPTAVKTEEMMAAQSPPPAGPHLGAVETREDANGEKYVYENKLSEEESITTEYSSSNSGVYRKVKLSNGKQVHSVLNSVGEFVDASDINRRADEPDPEARAWTGDRETGDLLAQLGALSENMDLSGEQAGKLVEVIRRLATGKISREQAQVEADAITGATAAIMQDVAKSERGGGMLHQPELLDKALDKARDYGRRIVEAAKQWAEVVDKAASGKLHERTILQMGKTPDLLTQIGLPGLTMVMEKSTFDKVQAIKAKHGRVHHLTKEQVTALYKEMADPVAVLRYGKGKNGFTVVTTLREDGDPVIVGLDVDVKAGRVRVNEVTSAYGRERFPGWLVGKAAAGELVYLEKKKTAAILEDMSGPQLAGVLRARQRSGVKLYTESDVVKPIYDDGGKKLNQDSAPGESAYSARAAKQAGPRAGVQFLDDGRAIIHLFQTADPSSIIHETGHILRRMLPERDQAIVEDWCSVKDGLWTREAEEQFAKGFERYLYEGQAPTSRLRRVFQTLRDMLVRVYGSIRNIGGVKLTPEVRQVFDRLVSTQAERDAEAQAADSVHSFRVDEDAGMPGYAEELAASFSEIKDYEDLMAEAERLAYERFDLERRKEHRTLRAQWRAEAREIVDGYLPHRAMDAAVALGGLDHAMVSESYDAEFVRLLTMKRPGLVKRGTGLSPDAVALEHGYTDAHDMLEDILDVPAKGQIITDYMARREEAYQRQRALDSDFGGDYKAVQEATLEILSKLTKAQNRRMETMQARATVDELRLYDLAKLRAQARMERTRLQDQAKQAFNAGDHRRAQLLLNQMSQNDLLLREMERALAEREKIERSARTMLTRKIDEDWRQQARNWAGLFGLGGAKAERGGPELLDFLSIKGLHHFVDQDAIASLSRVPKGALSVDQYRDAHRVLRQIIHFGTWDTRIMGQRKAQEFDAVMGQVLGAILAKGPASPQVNIHPEPPSARRTGTMGEFLDGVSAYHAELLKPEHIFRQLDGQEDMGAVWSACFKPIVGSRGDFLALGEEVQAKLQAAFAPVRKELAAWRKKRLTIEEVPRNVVIRKGKEVEVQQGAPLQLTMEEIVMVALNSGNDGNREAIKAGFQWTEGDMAAILSRLGEREWAVVHQVWAAIEAIYPHLNRAHKRLTGVELKKVQPLPFVARTQSGQEIEVKGGYFPLIFDRELNWKADRQAAQAEMQDLFQSIYQKPNPKSGFTKERVGGRMAPRLDFGVIARHVLDTAHYATHAVAIRDVQKITTDQRFREAVEAAWSRPVYEQIAPWLQNVARPAKEESSRMERFFARTRRNVQIVAMGWKPFTAFLQLTSLTSTAYKVGWAQTVRSVSALITHPHEAMQFVSERSIALRNRRNSFDRDVVDMLGQFDPSKSGMLDTVHRTAFALIGVVDSAVAYATWQAAYTQAMEQNGWSEEKACEYADMTVRLSQGDGAAMSLARVQHGNELRKFVTMFYSWFSTNYNNIAEANRRAFGEGASMPKTIELAKAYWWLLIAPAILEQLLRNGPPDDDEKKRGLGLSIFSYYMSSFPVLRSLSSALAEGRSFELSPVLSAIESPVDLANAFKAKKDRGRKVAKATLLGAGYLWGLPSRQAVTVMDAALDMAEGKTKNPLRFIVPAPKKKKNAATRRVTYGGN
ncbi:MAG: hypothetical protein Q8O35_06790, partial [Humidesulfovibrio sp.]|uniref:MuF-C-terminal domain-containing protein n=1 Tax=Humidesulfovibrio sp. TaxID=2910988 RepID=UPI002734CD12